MSENRVKIMPDHAALEYCGRIDFSNKKIPTFIYPYSSVSMSFTGTSISLIAENHHICWENNLGFIIDNEQGRIQLSEQDGIKTYVLKEGLAKGQHELLLFKRQDACHYFDFHGFLLDEGAAISHVAEVLERCIEVYGDSVSAGEVSEAVEYVGKPDPVHNGQYSNAYYSYAAFTARKLHARLHDIAQGGIALLDGTGYFAPGFGYKGMSECFDKLRYNPELGEVTKWDFNAYRPHVVIVAIGQNDNYPADYMKEDYHSEKSVHWREIYEKLLSDLREKYPKTLIIASTTILEHDISWDQSIDEVCKRLNDKKIVHFMYSQNGAGTPGHIRKPEAEKMAEELSAFIESFGEEIWE